MTGEEGEMVDGVVVEEEVHATATATVGSLLSSDGDSDGGNGSGSGSGPPVFLPKQLRVPPAKLAFVTGASTNTGLDMAHMGDRGMHSHLGMGSGGELLDGAVGEGQWSTRRSRGEGEGRGLEAGVGEEDGEKHGEAGSYAHPFGNPADDVAGDRDTASGTGSSLIASASASDIGSSTNVSGPVAAAVAAVVVAQGGSAAAAVAPPPPNGGDYVTDGIGGRGGDGASLHRYMTAHRAAAASSSAASSSPSATASAAAPSSPNLVDIDSLTAPPQSRLFNSSTGGGASSAAPTSVAGQGLGGSLLLLPTATDDPKALAVSDTPWLLSQPSDQQQRPQPVAIDMSGGQAGQAPSPRPVASSPGGQKGVSLNALAPAPSAEMSAHVMTHAILRPLPNR